MIRGHPLYLRKAWMSRACIGAFAFVPTTVVIHVRILRTGALLPFNLMTDNKARRKMTTVTTDKPRGCSVCETLSQTQTINYHGN